MTQFFSVVDLELTDREPSKAHVVEAAVVLCTPDQFVGSMTWLVKPPVSIPPETSAVHHIVDEDVALQQPWDVISQRVGAVMRVNPTAIMVAHNADCERAVLETLVPGHRWICTYKAAMRIWPNAPSFSNEGLRYYLKLPDLGRKFHQRPHSAKHDAIVTSQILTRLLYEETTVDELVAWTNEPALHPRCPIGQYRNLPWDEVPTDFLQWILYKAYDMREDIKFCARKEMQRRFPQEASANVR